MNQIKRGEIWLVELPFNQNSIQGNGIRPVVVVSNIMANTYSPILHGCPITSRNKTQLPTHVTLDINTGIMFKSIVLCEQTMPIPREAFIRQVGMCDNETMEKIEEGIKVQFALTTSDKTEKIIS